MCSKTQLRKIYRDKRNSLSTQWVQQHSAKVCHTIANHPIFHGSTTVAIYQALGNEVDLSALLTLPKTFVLPVIGSHNSMAFHVYAKNKKMVQNKYGILEPNKTPLIKPQEIDLCCLPLLAFNKKGIRLGMGGGYYDRYFALNAMQHKPTILVGIAYEWQESATIVAQKWDIPLDYIFTNKEVIKT